MQLGTDGPHAEQDPQRHRRAFGQELQRWRRLRGLTLRGLADLIPCSHTLLHEVEQAQDWPAPWMVVRADWCLGADQRLVDLFVETWLGEQIERAGEAGGPRDPARHHRDDRLLLAPEEAGLRIVDLCARIVAAVASWPPEMNRRVFLRWTSFGAASLPAVALAGSLDAVQHVVLGMERTGGAEALAAEQLRETVSVCRRLDDLGLPAAVLALGRRSLVRVDDLLAGCTSTAARQPLILLAGELSQLVGYAAAGLHDTGTARWATARALSAADEAGSAELHAYAMGLNLGDAEIYCRKEVDLAAATTAVGAAQDWARLSGNPAVLSHAQAVAARVHARAGHQSDALRALDRAQRHLERSTPEQRPTWLYWYDNSVLLEYRGQCLLDLQRAGAAGAGVDDTVAALRASLAERGGAYSRDRAEILMDLADTLWESGEKEESARHASDALVLAAGMERRRIRERLDDLHRRMRDDPLPACRDFTERYRTFFPA